MGDIYWEGIIESLKQNGLYVEPQQTPVAEESVFVKTDDAIRSAIDVHIDNIHRIGQKSADYSETFKLLEEENKNFAAKFASFAQGDPVVFPFDVFNDDSVVFSAVRMCAGKRTTLPKIPISYFYDVIQGEKVYTPSYVEWQTKDNKRKNFVVSCSNDAEKKTAIATINQMVLSIILSFPVNKVHVNIINLDNTLDFVNLSGCLDDQLVTLISNESELRRFADKLFGTIKKASTTSGFSSAEGYNDASKTVSFPYELVLISNYSGKSFARVEESMLSFFNNGSGYGIYFFLINDSNLREEGRTSFFLESTEAYLNIQSGGLNDILDDYSKPEALVNTVLYANDKHWKDLVFDYINSAVHKKAEFIKDWNALAIAPYPEVDSDIDSPIGFLDDGREFRFKMGVSNSHYHAFVLGDTGSGKTRFLHDIILSITTQYKPEDLELYLIDFKGVEFGCYRDLKHCRTILVDSEDDQVSFEVINGLKEELDRRQKLFRSVGANEVGEYNRGKFGDHLTQIILLVDECQTFFENDVKHTALQRETIKILSYIATKGRAYGVHLLLATQSLANTPQLGKEILDQISDFYILPCKPQDAARLVRDDEMRLNAERAVAKMELNKGQCYFIGKEGNQMFTFDYVPKTELQSKLIQATITKSLNHPSNGQVYLNGSMQFSIDEEVARYIENSKGKSIMTLPGRDISLSQKPITIRLKEDRCENVLLVGKNGNSQEHLVTRTTMNLLASLIIANKKKECGYRFLIFDCLNDEEADYYYLLEDLQKNGLCEIVKPRHRANELMTLCNEISTGTVQPTVLIIIGQERFKDLEENREVEHSPLPNKNDIAGTIMRMNQIKTNAQCSNSKIGTIRTVGEALNFVLDNGPENNVHTIMQLNGISKYLFLDFVGKTKISSKFKHWILQHSDASDGSKLSLNDNIHIDRIDNNPDRLRAYYYNDDSDAYQLFTPFVLPTTETIINLIK